MELLIHVDAVVFAINSLSWAGRVLSRGWKLSAVQRDGADADAFQEAGDRTALQSLTIPARERLIARASAPVGQWTFEHLSGSAAPRGLHSIGGSADHEKGPGPCYPTCWVPVPAGITSLLSQSS